MKDAFYGILFFSDVKNSNYSHENQECSEEFGKQLTFDIKSGKTAGDASRYHRRQCDGQQLFVYSFFDCVYDEAYCR